MNKKRACITRFIPQWFLRRVLVNLFLFLVTFLNVLNNMDYTVTYFFHIPSTKRRTRVRSELFKVSLVSSRVEFYTALPVSFVEYFYY